MRQLPYDYSRCANSKCPLARFCLRHLSPGRPDWQVFSEFPGGESCHGFIDANKSPQEAG